MKKKEAGNRVAVLRHSRVMTCIWNCFGNAVVSDFVYKVELNIPIIIVEAFNSAVHGLKLFKLTLFTV